MKNVNKANILIEIKMLANFQHFFCLAIYVGTEIIGKT